MYRYLPSKVTPVSFSLTGKACFAQWIFEYTIDFEIFANYCKIQFFVGNSSMGLIELPQSPSCLPDNQGSNSVILARISPATYFE
jgi:hypothetical protein